MKRTSLKHLNTLAASDYVSVMGLFKGKWGLADPKHWGGGLSEAMTNFTEGWDFWYDSILEHATEYYGDAMLAYLKKQGIDTTPLDEGHDNFDEDLYDTFKLDVARAYADACKDAAEADFQTRVTSSVEEAIEKVGAPYYCLLKLDRYWDDTAKTIHSRGWQETDHLYEAERVMFGFTRAWHKEQLSGLPETYVPDEIESWVTGAIEEVIWQIDTDGLSDRLDDCPNNDDHVLMFFSDYNDIEHALKTRQQEKVAAAEFNTNHWAWVARTTQRMTTQENHHG